MCFYLIVNTQLLSYMYLKSISLDVMISNYNHRVTMKSLIVKAREILISNNQQFNPKLKYYFKYLHVLLHMKTTKYSNRAHRLVAILS